MKKYSSEYFEKKYRILFNKLLIKQGFLDSIKEARNKLGLPENGFDNETELARFFISKMNKEEKRALSFFAFASDYASKNAIDDNDENKEKTIKAYIDYITECQKKKNKDMEIVPMIIYLTELISYHEQMITKIYSLEKNKTLSKLYPETMKLIRKFWALDLLDEHIMGYFVERYLFLGNYGINQYIKSKIACPNCRYIGVNHFSPTRKNMKSKEAFGKNYIFNDDTVRLLSVYFNCVFLIIEPYATKEEVLQYVEDNWDNLKEHIIEKNAFYKQFDVHPSKIKESDFDKNQLIYSLYKLSKKELAKQFREYEKDLPVPTYKEQIISNILEKKYTIKMTSDAIKKSATRFKKSTKLTKEPRDIGDI